LRNQKLQEELQGELRDEFTFTRELPRGGMSRVFVATENALGRQVVIKVLSPELAATLSAERFKREIAVAARLQHPNIVPLLSAGQAGHHLYYTMPLVAGESLRERLGRERPMAIGSIERILEELARALAYAHDEGVAHRDIKPENVMFFHGQAVVLDFGIGKALQRAAVDGESAEPQVRITMPGMSLGTPTYIAPEQAAGDPGLDHRADLYALGVIAYEMLTGHPPFAGRSPAAVMAAHASNIPAPILQKRPDAPPHLVAIVMKCLEKKPQDRPANAHEIVRALDPATRMASANAGGVLARVPSWVAWAIAGGSLTVTLGLAARLFLRP
jgi:eukaryotic-like serine/threonine-protein kinase